MKKLEGNLYKQGETVNNYSDSSFETLEPGAYICEIVDVIDHPDQEFLEIGYDIHEGALKGYFQRLSDRFSFWGGTFRAYYTDKAKDVFFAPFCKHINASNKGLEFNPFSDGKNADEHTLKKKLIGVVLHREIYTKADGSIGTRCSTDIKGVISVEAAKEGKFNKKLLADVDRTTDNNGFKPVKEEVEGILFQ